MHLRGSPAAMMIGAAERHGCGSSTLCGNCQYQQPDQKRSNQQPHSLTLPQQDCCVRTKTSPPHRRVREGQCRRTGATLARYQDDKSVVFCSQPLIRRERFGCASPVHRRSARGRQCQSDRRDSAFRQRNRPATVHARNHRHDGQAQAVMGVCVASGAVGSKESVKPAGHLSGAVVARIHECDSAIGQRAPASIPEGPSDGAPRRAPKSEPVRLVWGCRQFNVIAARSVLGTDRGFQ